MEKNKLNWWIDLVLLALFWIAFFPDLTGLALHEWLGAAAIGLGVAHLVLHWRWFLNAADRFFSGMPAPLRIHFLIDLGAFLGFWMILLTGLLISTWLNLPVYDLAAWTDVHLAVSVFTLLLVVGKLILHWRWVAGAVQRYVLAPAAAGAPRAASPVTRRDFIKVSGILGAATALTVHSLVHDAIEADARSSLESDALPAPSPLPPATESASATEQPVAGSTAQPTAAPQELPAAACAVLCPNGCSYPGRCRRYVDRNGNGKCDNGECL